VISEKTWSFSAMIAGQSSNVGRMSLDGGVGGR